MPEEVIYYVTRYGYLAIFILVLLQETGMPNPFPNELLLIFSGYLSSRGLLYLPNVILTAVLADFIGTNILYFIFYNAGTFILQKKPNWVPLSSRMIAQLTTKISGGGQLSIFIFRLTPFTRGYASVIAGLLHVRPKVFLPIALASAVTWASIYVVVGRLAGPSWGNFIEHTESFKYLMVAVLALLLCLIILVYYYRKRKNSKFKIGNY